MKIRIAKEADIVSLAEFNQAMAFETESRRLDHQRLTDGVTAVFSDPSKGFYVVAEDAAGSIIGGLLVTTEWSDWRNGWFWWIQSVYVLPDHRGLGIYAKMYKFVKDAAGDDVCGFRLYVEQENTSAQAVYKKMGMHRLHYDMYEAGK